MFDNITMECIASSLERIAKVLEESNELLAKVVAENNEGRHLAEKKSTLRCASALDGLDDSFIV